MNHSADLAERRQDYLVFHLTGKRAGPGVVPIEDLHLRPALFARVGDLAGLRYDYPLVLVEPEEGGEWLRSLSGIVDELLKKIAPAGLAGERLRRHVLRAERKIRELLQEGAAGTLTELWDEAASLLVARGGEAVGEDLARARSALGADGSLLDCDAATPARLMTHAWRWTEGLKAQAMRRRIDELVVRLSDLVRADHLRSEAGRRADTLEAGIGGAHRALFDFQKMADLLARPSGASALPESRRRRIDSVLATLRGQRFFAAQGGHEFIFEETRDAIAAYRRRLPEMAELVRAMAIAELEAHGRYTEHAHDPMFEGWSEDSIGAEERSRFPSYLVCRTVGRARKDGGGAAARALLLKVLASNAPVKIVVESGSLLEEARGGGSGFSFGAQLAASAMGLSQAYVLQSAASHLYQMRHRLIGAMRYAGAALVSIYSGARAEEEGDGPSGYLLAAAAMESRAFPAFSYDPGAGADWAARFSLEGNPQPDLDWPRHPFSWADEKLQRVEEMLPFTLADFAVCEPRYARHFARVPREASAEGVTDVAEWLASPQSGVPAKLPCLQAVDDANRLHRLIVDEKLLQAARVCRDAWRRLQELDRLKQKEIPAAKEERKEEVKQEVKQEVKPKEASKPEPVEEKREPGDPYIETERCSSCNECTNLNNVLFAYNENKQAYIANPDGGTFRELVEAAEACQVAVIHPGKPRNPKEPDLEELVKRAEPFQ
jgi:hypothetical protein